ncbi:MAG: hypothetical protein WBM61_07185 [Woeseiaceae bacterium]
MPEKSHGWFRDWFRKVWKVRGGGLYALGFALSFVYFEVGSLGDDIRRTWHAVTFDLRKPATYLQPAW